ncbi:hypothetical protein F4818DRAFT_21829 [Hypoxylon cercidicola]|nr:hypothetical protein F4818DRAFT_21829 [Hypoxylon cercidicola]
MASSKGRSRFQADVKLAAEKDIPNISHISKGDAEDEFTCVYTHSGEADESRYEIRVQPQDTSSYPNENSFLTYTNHDVPREVAQVLDDSIGETAGMKVVDMLTRLSRRLRAALQSDTLDADNDVTMTDADEPDIITDDYDSESEPSFGDADMFGDDDNTFGNGGTKPTNAEPMNISSLDQQRLRRDLISVFGAGFHTGKACGFEKGTIQNVVWISIRVNKLRLSKETREAWDLASSDYVILLIRYLDRYTSFEDAMNMPAQRCNMTFRLRKSSKKKPTVQQAVATFQDKQPHRQESDGPELSCLWFGKSIDSFMDSEFISLLKLRKLKGISWDQAKEMLQFQLKSATGDTDWLSSIKDEQSTRDDIHNHEAQLPPFLVDDHLLSKGEISLQLIATQFALHYLVRCTDYCTNCHRKMEGNFDALKPYVCSEPLCLHQYLNLGFGPSIESEIINQPKVVDLLVSLCFASLSSPQGQVRMREFPTGLNLQVPQIRKYAVQTEKPELLPRCVQVSGGVLVDPVDVSFDKGASTATITGRDNFNLHEGQWVVVVISVSTSVPSSGNPLPSFTNGEVVLYHARIQSKMGTLLMLDIVSQHTMPDLHTPKTPLVGKQVNTLLSMNTYSGYLVLCNQELDSLDNTLDKALSMSIILAALPSVEDMRSYLTRNPLKELHKWDRMPRAAFDLLRWIIASNRSYIVQVDGGPTDSLARPHEKISGVDGWIQFRFAQGSPENDTRFNDALEGIKKPQKTLVAWHGSALENWHSIIRQGLDYTMVVNGRAFGNGVYFSRFFDTSEGYSGSRSRKPFMWPQSSLRVAAVMSLNELINLPEQFVSRNPHYVLQVCHWTRCRYLFVKHESNRQTNPSPLVTTIPTPVEQSQIPEFIQDPGLVALGPRGSRLFIPKRAIPSTQGDRTVSAGLAEDMLEVDLDSSEDEEDLEYLHFQEDQGKDQGEDQEGDQGEDATDFRPGTLDYSTLPTLAPPSYATSIAQKTLGQEIKKLHMVQSKTPLHQLGWYIDFDNIRNMFQWIVELHSFDASLPLAQDMKKKGITSIVIEMRFLSSFPMSPPFVRVISPRFLPFANGGGGHVTAGGAMCMELLTNTGWSPVSSLESVLLQVRMAICSESPPARLDNAKSQSTAASQYNIREAIEAYTRAALVHGWKVPEDLRDLNRN